MQELLLIRRMDGAEDSLVRPVAGIFASTIMLPQLGPAIPARSAREIKLVSYLVDLLLEGKLLEGLDVFFQRLKALETAHSQDGEGWAAAGHLELQPTGATTLLEPGERHYVQRQMREEARSMSRRSSRKRQE
jgi:hypothetical protein